MAARITQPQPAEAAAAALGDVVSEATRVSPKVPAATAVRGNVPARLSLAAFLQPAGVTVGDVTDMTLSGHQQAADVVPMRWPAHNATSGEDYAREEDEERYSRASGTQLMLRPRRLRTVRFCAGRVH